ncbi:hypothetical protein [Pseudarthrobacter sp. 1C304]|uniref:hypothetical protein n=1 Tax=Pseudarthrobacter sp. 1C304 TaxID=3457438 RepID=UPI003FD60D69
MALKGGFKNFANQTKEIKDAPPIDLGAEGPALHIVHAAVGLHEAPTTQPSTHDANAVGHVGPAGVEHDGGVATVAEAQLDRTPVRTGPADVSIEADEPVTSGRTHYTELVRKELRLHADQADELTILASKVQRARKEKGERITDNTLIRVAVDLLLQRQAELVGSTEDELRVALGLTPRTQSFS